jgi:hypothetical protein
MRATLTYNLPEEDDRFDAAVRSTRLVNAVREYLYATRQKIKHSDIDEAEARVVQRCRTELLLCLEANGVEDIIHR